MRVLLGSVLISDNEYTIRSNREKTQEWDIIITKNEEEEKYVEGPN